MTESSGTLVVLNPETTISTDRARVVESLRPSASVGGAEVVDPRRMRRRDWQVGRDLAEDAHADEGLFGEAETTRGGDHRDGWFRTGDAGFLDGDGYVFLFDRFKDMIVSGGENVYPAEIENVLNAHPRSARSASSAPHEKWIETPMAVVVLKLGAEVDRRR